MRKSSASFAKYARLGSTVALGSAIAFCSASAPRAQRMKETEVKVTGVASRASEKEAVVSISADGNLTRAQTWQDRDGTFHVVVPKGQTTLKNSGSARGVKIQHVGDSLEIIVQAKPGAGVTVQPRFNRLDLVVSGGLQEGGAGVEPETGGVASAQASARGSQGTDANSGVNLHLKRRLAAASASAVEKASKVASKSARANSSTEAQQPAAQQDAGTTAHADAAPAAQSGVTTQNAAPATANETAAASTTVAPPPATATGTTDQPALAATSQQQPSFIFSPTFLFGLLGVAGLGGFLFVRRRRQSGDDDEAGEERVSKSWNEVFRLKRADASVESSASADSAFEQAKGDRRKGGDRRFIERKEGDRRKSGVGAEPQATRQTQPGVALEAQGGDKKASKRESRLGPISSLPAVLFGAFRIDQEVAKLTTGEAHAIDVLASRATDDRRAIETSLIKVIRAPEADEDNRRRARTALEEYGFVARQSAMLLLAPEAYERASAARVLGEIRSSSSLPFLLEALYDPEGVVRNEVVTSLGSLRLPRAIGALIDLARRYPEMPSTLLRPALNACSVETLELAPGEQPEIINYVLPSKGTSFTGDIGGLESPQEVEQLPEWLEDESLADALERLSSTDIEARTLAAQKLAQFQVQRSVDALAAMSACDIEPVVRAAAVTSLGAVDHESVFAPVLMALADEAREVRAAAARSLSRLSFDRADAYVRVIEVANKEMLRGVARACVKAGLAAQALDRLTSEDRRQAYEAFSLLSLVVKSGEISLVLEAIASHTDLNVRLAAIKLLCMMGRTSELAEPLRRLAGRDSMPEKVRVAIHEAVSHIEQGEAVSAGSQTNATATPDTK